MSAQEKLQLTDYDVDLIGLDIGWPQTAVRTERIRRDDCVRKAVKRHPGEREDRIVNHLNRVNMEMVEDNV